MVLSEVVKTSTVSGEKRRTGSRGQINYFAAPPQVLQHRINVLVAQVGKSGHRGLVPPFIQGVEILVAGFQH